MTPQIFSAQPPQRPGVYIFRDGRKHPIYIGKAKSLGDRLASYRAKMVPEKTSAMLEAARSLDWIVFNSELEALLCEAAMVREYKPKYNILLRDDKRFPMILITDEPYPKAMKVRRARRGFGRHFGPFRGGTANHLLEIISRRYKIRRCGGPLPKRDRPCIDFDIGRCDAPCVDRINRDQYGELVEQAVKLLSGDVKTIVKEFNAEMKHAAAEHNYEKAAGLRDEIAALRSLYSKQDAEKPCREDADAIAAAVGESIAVGVVLSRRKGAVTDRAQYVFELPIETEVREVYGKTLLAHYESHPHLPALLMSPNIIFDPLELELLNLGADCDVRAPQRGVDAAFLALAEENARDILRVTSGSRSAEQRNLALVELAEILGMKHPPRTIEGFDISTFAGKDTVGASVGFADALPRKADYRMYRIRGRQDSDVDAMREVVARRLGSKAAWPTLILIDGGMGQLLAAHEALEEAVAAASRESSPPPVLISLEKRDELVRTVEGEVITLSKHSPALRLLQHVRDEAHRFGGNYHRKLRGKVREVLSPRAG